MMIIPAAATLLSRSRQPGRVRWIHRCSAHLLPGQTGGDRGGRDDGGNGGVGIDKSHGSDSAANDNNMAAPVPVQTWNKSPIVSQLWRTRDEAKRRVMSGARGDYSVSYAAAKVLSDAAAAISSIDDGNVSLPSISDAPTKSKGKHPRESDVGIPYLFSQDRFLLETYRNPWGEMRFGKILEDLDALAGNIAFNHVVDVEGNDTLPLIVTAGVDRIRVRRRPNIDTDQYLSGKVTWVGSSSMEIRMRITDGGNEDGGTEWLEAYFTFVTLHPETKKAINIPSLIPETDEERVYFELGAVKAQARKEARRNKVELGRPLSEQSLKIDARAKRLLEEAGPLLQMPSLADPNTMLISQTVQSNAMVAQPQARNLHDRIFGGFLMRRAFELAFATAYLFGGDKPRFLEVDDISFDKAIDVGDLLVFKSLILYTNPDGRNLGSYVDGHEGMPLVVVEVACWVTCPEMKKAEVSNHFYFTFALPHRASCRRVLPANIDEARRQASRMFVDETQAELRP